MRSKLYCLFILSGVFCPLFSVAAADNVVDSVRTPLDSVWVREQSWVYNSGDTGFFISLRSCRCGWLGIHDASMTLESGDSVLNIKGRVVDELEGRDLTGWQVEMLVWRESDSGADMANTDRTPGISEQTFLPIPADFEFDLNIPLTPRTHICVIPVSVAGSDGVPLSVSVIYQVGRLLEMR